MNPTKNYNAYTRWTSCPKLVTPIPGKLPGEMSSYVPRRLKAEKLRDIKQFKKLGTEENIIGYCNRCELPRPFARKSPSNVHYNCVKRNCCVMLHQWDVCNYCLADMHGPKLTHDDPQRQKEVAQFHNVFVQLPDDLKKYIGEFVPLIFNYVEKISRLVFVDRKMAYLDQYVSSCPKTTWKSIAGIISKKYVLKNPINKSSSKQQIFNAFKEQYAKIYIGFRTSLIVENDYWTHHKYVHHRTGVCWLIEDLEKAKQLL